MTEEYEQRAKIFQQAIQTCHSNNPTDCIEWFADRIIELEARNEILERRIARAKECMKKLIYVSREASLNCKGLIQDAEDFIYNRTCNIRKQGQHCITGERCIMCDK